MALKRYSAVLLVLLLGGLSDASAQGFGKNKVQYFSADWNYLQSEHFDIYFYQDGYAIAEFVADAAEEATWSTLPPSS